MTPTERIVLVGFSGGGKSTIGQLLADRLAWTCLDTDMAIEAEFERSIPEIFASHGETEFRAVERRILGGGLASSRVVIPTGGGAVADPRVWEADLLGQPGTLTVALDVSPAVALRRLRDQEAAAGVAVGRPMLAGDDPLDRITTLKTERQAIYDRSAITLIVDDATPGQLVDEIISLLPEHRDPETTTIHLATPSGQSHIAVEPGLAASLGTLARATWPRTRRAWIISDDRVAPLHGSRAQASLASSGFQSRLQTVPAGEASKSAAVAGDLWDWLLDIGIERGDLVVALGGGVIGDLAGFVAATTLRGVGLAQVPTSLLACVDSSVGGKTGINHRAGKNLIGAFYQPPLVVIDPALLRTLPPRELTAGWAEIIKHARIQPSTPGGERGDLLSYLERNADRLLALEEPATSFLIRRNVALKAAVVTADERESGIRAYLNFGHTLGHAIEAAGYTMLHGEAIAVGMLAAATIGLELAMIDRSDLSRLHTLIARYGLPTRAAVDPETVLSLLGSDKKRSAGRQRWVLPVRSGGVTIRDDVSEELVRRALLSVIA